MAEMDTSSSGGGKHKGGKRAKKASTRVDLTAMVDLGFLLITFFMLTTTLNKPKVMELNMPDKDKKGDDMPVKESLTTSFILAGGDSLYYWHGIPKAPGDVKLTNYSDKGMRQIILTRQGEIEADKKAGTSGYGPKDGLIVLLKPLDKARYKNMVDFLDEMTITDTDTYAIVDVIPQDKKYITDFFK
jgi:biopolymer transport protein ExbD